MIDLVDIAPAFSFVVGKGLVPGTSSYDPQSFGNASLVMVGTPFSIRFVRDRGQVLVEVGNDPAEWYSLAYVLEFVDGSVTQQQFSEPPNTVVLANLLQRCWSGVADLFSDKKKVLQLQVFTKRKTSAFLSKIFRKR